MKCLYEIKMLIPMKKTYIRISPDIDVLCINSDSCCASAYGDEIYNDSPWLGPRFSIVVPGIEEWVKRYEDATDFAETTTEPSFDWISWLYEGLCFAKAIWELQKSCWKTYANKVFKGINDMLKNTAQIVHSRHRSVNNFIMNLISALGAYCFFDNKPKALQGYCIKDTKQLSLF